MTTQESLALLRRGLLVLLLVGMVGLFGELVLMDHYKDARENFPFGLLFLTVIVTSWHWYSESRMSLRWFQAVMLLLIVVAPVGICYHLRLNYAMARQLEPLAKGLDLWIKAFKGDAPMIAPASFLQFGLLGLLYGYKHPALDDRKGD